MKIVYVTNSGSTKQYAELLGEKTGLEVYELSKAKKEIDGSEEIIFMGWVMAGAVQGLPQAREYFSDIKAVCAVGLTINEKATAELTEKNGIEEKLFLLRGNFHIDELKGMYKMMMGMMLKMLKSKLKDKPSEDGDKIISAIENGVDCVSEENLEEIIQWLNG